MLKVTHFAVGAVGASDESQLFWHEGLESPCLSMICDLHLTI